MPEKNFKKPLPDPWDISQEVAGMKTSRTELFKETKPVLSKTITHGQIDLQTATPGELRVWLLGYSEADLAKLSYATWHAMLDKARDRGDRDVEISDAFDSSFPGKDKLGIMPWLVDGILWSPGSRQDKSAQKHVCRFIRVGHGDKDFWVWEHPGCVVDEVRRETSGAKIFQHSITLVAVEQGASVDVITSNSVGGVHQVQRVDSFKVKGPELEKISTRRVGKINHR